MSFRDLNTYHSHSINPDIHGVASAAQVRFIEFVFLGPSKRGIAQTFLHNSMEPGQEEVETGTLIWSLKIEKDYETLDELKQSLEYCEVSQSKATTIFYTYNYLWHSAGSIQDLFFIPKCKVLRKNFSSELHTYTNFIINQTGTKRMSLGEHCLSRKL